MASTLTILGRSPGTRIGILDLDAAVTQAHGFTAEVTEHPVETGANIADHVRQKPATLSIEGIVSNNPIGAASSVASSAIAAGAAAGAGQLALPNRAATAFEQLLAIKEGGQLVTVATALRTYESLVMTALNVPRDAHTGDAVRFTATFQQVRLVSTQTVAITSLPAAQPPQKDGKKSAAVAPPEKRVSVALQLLQAGGFVPP